MKLKRFIAVLVVISICGCVFAKSKKGKTKYRLLIGNTSTSAVSNPLNQIAFEKNYFKDNDLTVDYVTLQETGSFESLSVGKVDALFVEVVTPISYALQNADITIFGGNVSGGMIAVARKNEAEELRDIKNWKGKKIGAIQYSRTEIVARHSLKDLYGYAVGKDLTIVNVEDYASVQLGVVKGNIDIGFVPSNFAEGAVDSGLVVLFPLTHLEEDYVCCRQSAYSKKLKSDRNAYLALLKAQIKAYKDYQTDPEGSISVIAKNAKQTKEYVRDYVYNVETNGNRKNNPDPNYNGILVVYNTLQELKYVTGDRPLYDFVDISVYAQAVKEVIAENPGDEFYVNVWNTFVTNNNQYPNFEKDYGSYIKA